MRNTVSSFITTRSCGFSFIREARGNNKPQEVFTFLRSKRILPWNNSPRVKCSTSYDPLLAPFLLDSHPLGAFSPDVVLASSAHLRKLIPVRLEASRCNTFSILIKLSIMHGPNKGSASATLFGVLFAFALAQILRRRCLHLRDDFATFCVKRTWKVTYSKAI